MMMLNLGCGDRYAVDWVNVDFETPHRIDQQVDLTGPLPWEPGTITHAYAGHLFEHLTPEDGAVLAKQLLVCMAPGGLLVAVGPDLDVVDWQVADGTYDWSWGHPDLLRRGAGRWSGDVHLWETTGPKVASLLRDAGWSTVTEIDLVGLAEFWPVADRGPTWQYAIKATA